MPFVTFTLSIVSDVGSPPAIIFQKIHRTFVTEAQVLNLIKAGSDGVGVFTAVPTANVFPAVNALVLSNDSANPINFRLCSAAPADGIIAMKANGFIAMVDCNLAAGATANVTVNNVNVAAAALSGFVGGT